MRARLDVGGARVQRVLHELLDGRAQVQDDLPGADAVHRALVDGLDGRHCVPRTVERPAGLMRWAPSAPSPPSLLLAFFIINAQHACLGWGPNKAPVTWAHSRAQRHSSRHLLAPVPPPESCVAGILCEPQWPCCWDRALVTWAPPRPRGSPSCAHMLQRDQALFAAGGLCASQPARAAPQPGRPAGAAPAPLPRARPPRGGPARARRTPCSASARGGGRRVRGALRAYNCTPAPRKVSFGRPSLRAEAAA